MKHVDEENKLKREAVPILHQHMDEVVVLDLLLERYHVIHKHVQPAQVLHLLLVLLLDLAEDLLVLLRHLDELLPVQVIQYYLWDLLHDVALVVIVLILISVLRYEHVMVLLWNMKIHMVK